MTSAAGGGLRVVKVFNNSVVLGSDASGREFVLLGRGIGFQRLPGDALDDSAIEKRFVPGDDTTEDRLAAYLREIPTEDLALTQEIIDAARTDLGSQVNEGVLFPLADHISYAIRRTKEGSSLEYPLKWEIASLYPREVAFARRALEMIATARGVRLPGSEAIPLALHFVNAQLGAGDISAAMKVTDALTDGVAILRKELAVSVDDESAETARFVTHLRYLIARCMNGKSVATLDAVVHAALRSNNASEHSTAMRVADMVEQRFGKRVSDDERMYLTIHVARLAGAKD